MDIRYQHLVEEDPTGSFVCDCAGRLLLCNPSFARMTGFESPAQAVARSARLFDDAGERDALLSGIRPGAPSTRERLVLRHDGASLRIREHLVGRWDAAGGLCELQGYWHDLSVLGRAEESVHEQTTLLSNAQRIGRMGSWSLDLSDERMQWSAETCALFGIAPEQFRGTRAHFYEFMLPEDRPRMAADYGRVVASGGLLDVESEFRIRRPDGEIRWMLVRGNAQRDACGRIARRVGMFMDITERKSAEERILRLNRVYALFSASNAALVRVRVRQSIFDMACRIAVETGKMRAAWIGLIDQGVARVVAQTGELQGYLEEILITSTLGPNGGGPFGTAMREGRPAVCNDVANDAAFAPWRGNALARGFRSVGAFPLKLGGRTIGGFVHYADVVNFFDDEEVQVLDELAANISYAIEFVDHDARRLDAEIALRQSEERFRAMYEQAAVGICLVSMEYRFTRVNKRFCDIVGYDADHLLRVGDCVATTHPDDRAGDAEAVARLLAGAGSVTVEKRYVRRDERIVWVRMTLSVLRSIDGDPQQFIGVIEDISERRLLEEQLRRVQRLESIGQLTGGVAHDFNNLLTVILGGADLLYGEAHPGSEQRAAAEVIIGAAERGAELTRRLLAFARRQSLQPTAVDINRLVTGLIDLQRRTLGENIEIVFAPGESLRHARVDAGQLESALLNLTINARDAMPEGGRLTIETCNVTIDEDHAERLDVSPGDYVRVSVTDSGTGIAAQDMRHVFEPFFTTKDTGKGTGLGLAMVYGFIRQSGGHVEIYSELGHGTSVKLYLPHTNDRAERVPQRIEGGSVAHGGREAILLVEDDDQVRRLARGQLIALGYRVIETSNGSEALEVLRGVEHVDLLFTDMVMPEGMSGRQLAEEARRMRPALKVLYTSGYAEKAMKRHGGLDPGARILGKPYRRDDLARSIRGMLTPT